MAHDFSALVRRTYAELNEYRWRRYGGGNNVAVCEPCKSEGRGLVLAHYEGIAAGRTHDGKAVPPMCWHHKWKKPLPALTDQSASAREEDSDEPKATVKTPPQQESIMDELCSHGCGKPRHRGRCAGFKRTTTDTTAPPRAARVKGSSSDDVITQDDKLAIVNVLDDWWRRQALGKKARIFAQQQA